MLYSNLPNLNLKGIPLQHQGKVVHHCPFCQCIKSDFSYRREDAEGNNLEKFNCGLEIAYKPSITLITRTCLFAPAARRDEVRGYVTELVRLSISRWGGKVALKK